MDIIKKRINEIANKRQADIEKQINLCISEIGKICESSLQESIKQADNFEGELLLKQKRLEFIIKSSISKLFSRKLPIGWTIKNTHHLPIFAAR